MGSLWSRLTRWLPVGAVPEIDARALAASIDGADAPLLLDVRTAAEFRQSRIPGAVHAPVPSLPARLDALAVAPGRPVVAICLSAHRSIPAVRLLRARGHDGAVQLRGGMLAWWREGLPTTSGD